ncbi:MAG: hypothetical protein V7L25_01025 [Nostoc sp.]
MEFENTFSPFAIALSISIIIGAIAGLIKLKFPYPAWISDVSELG